MNVPPGNQIDDSETLFFDSDEVAIPKSTSKKQLLANEANAKKSTGPKSDAGKKASSQNARKHDIFTRRIEPVHDGMHAEKPDEFYRRVDMIVDSLLPRDAVEYEAATRVAGLYISLGRLDRWSDLTIEDAALVTEADIKNGAGTTRPRITILSRTAQELLAHVDGGQAHDDHLELFAHMVRYFGPNPEVGIKDLWTSEREPSSPVEWGKAFRALRAHHWKDEDEFRYWVVRMNERFSLEFDRVWNIEERNAAKRILNGPFELRTKYEARLGNELDRMLRVLARLQERVLPDG